MINANTLWAPLVTSGRKPWIVWTCVRSTRRDARKAYVDGIPEIHHKKHLSQIKFVKVHVVLAVEQKGQP